ncbi:MAG: sulfatase-like hydrolase/transferase [Rhodospirillales bacterium]
MTKRNILILMSDEHARRVTGCYGDPLVRTPNIDALAARGVRFETAYSASPICVPARAALATGRPVHETGHWDNAHPYEGRPESWAHKSRQAGYHAVSIGKLHYRDAMGDTGFSEQKFPMHVENGRGDVAGSIREPLPVRHQSRKLAERLGPGETNYTRYDEAVRDAACDWLRNEAGQHDGWLLFVSFVAPHFPLVAPPQFYDLYSGEDLAPGQPVPDSAACHPWLSAMRKSYVYDNFNDARRCEALRSYYGLVSFLDSNIGQVLDALEGSGAAPATEILYFSDHGDNLGERGMWGKSTFYEESVGIPLIHAAPQSRSVAGTVCHTPVSLTDIYPTVLSIAGGVTAGEEHRQTLMDIAASADDRDRVVLSQYHAAGSPTAGFMLRQGDLKYCHYVGYEPQLFNLKSDPRESVNLASQPGYARQVEAFEARLSELLGKSPAEIDRQAKAAQALLVERHGGADAVLSGPILTATSTPVR